MKRTVHKKKVFYLRLSTEKKDKDGNIKSEEEQFLSQEAELRRLHGEPDEIHREVKSGGDELKVLAELIATLPKGSSIYGVEIDRITRQGPFHLGYIVGTAKLRQISLFTSDGELTNLDGMAEVYATFKASFAKIEREAVSRRMKAMIKSRKEKGLKWGFEISRKSPNWKPGAKEVNPLWEKALPRLTELKKAGHTVREISEIASREFGAKIPPTQVHRLVGHIEKESGKWRSRKRKKEAV